MVTDHPQHMRLVLRISRERSQFARHFRTGGIGHACHDCRQRTTKRATLIAVIAQAHIHQKSTNIRISQTQSTEFKTSLGNFF